MGMQRQLRPEDGNPTQKGVVKPQGFTGELSVPAVPGRQKSHGTQDMHLMERVVSNENVVRALKKLEKKAKSAPGIDGMTVPELRPYLRANWPTVVDLGLSKFFDRVNHDMLMARVARKAQDKRVLKLIRRYLEPE